MKLKRPLYGPGPRGPSQGRDVRDFVKRTLNRLPAALPVGERFFPKPPGGFDDVYNAKTVAAVKIFQQFAGVSPITGQFGQATLDAMWPYADAYSQWVYRLWSAPRPPVLPEMVSPVDVGPVPSALHETAGLSGNWALDFIDPPGTVVRSPEDGQIWKLSGHDPSDDTADSQGVYGWTVYVLTPKQYLYFITHLGWRPALVVGQAVNAGQVIGKIGDQRYRPDHTHVGVTSPLGETDAKRRILEVANAPRIP